MTSAPPRVLLVSSTLPGVLRNRLVKAGALVVGEVLVGARISEAVHRMQPSVIVVETPTQHPGLSEALSAVAQLWPSLPVIAPLSADGPPEFVVVDASAPASLEPSYPESSLAREVLGMLTKEDPVASPAALEAGSRSSVSVIAVGCSTGGPAALEEVLRGLPQDFPVPIVVAQHMPAEFTALFADRLDRSLGLHVVEASEGTRMHPATVYIAPGDRHLEVRPGGFLSVHDSPKVNSSRPSVDVLFSSLASSFPGLSGCLLLSGMGDDGVEGARRVVDGGGFLICQDEASSVVWGMPGAAVRAGIRCVVLPLTDIACELRSRVGGSNG